MPAAKLGAVTVQHPLKKASTFTKGGNHNPGPSPTPIQANKTAKKVAVSTTDRWKIDWFGTEEGNKTTRLFCKACS